MEHKYTFHEKGHRHLLDGKPLTGITTVLNVIAKPFLIPWAVDMAIEYIDKTLQGQCEKDNEGDLLEWLGDNWPQVKKDAKLAHTKKKEEAGVAGTDVHAICEGIVKEAIKDNLGYVKAESIFNDNQQVKHFVNWATSNKVKFLASELHLYSESLYLGGICDIVAEIDGDIWLVDLKTGSGIYVDAMWQMGGYHIMVDELKLYSSIKGYIVLNLKKDGTFLEKRCISNEENKKAFLACLDIYRIKQKIEGSIL